MKDAETYSSVAMGGLLAPEEGGERARQRTLDAVAQGALIVGSLSSQDPPVHTAQRNIVSRGFTPRVASRRSSRGYTRWSKSCSRASRVAGMPS